MVYAIIYSFLLGYGIEMGSELYITFDNDPSVTNPAPICQVAANANTCVSSESRWFYFLTVPLFALSYCQLLRMRLPRWPVAIVVSGTGFVINWLLSCKAAAPSQVVQVVPAFAVGLFGNILTKVTSRMSFDIVLIAVGLSSTYAHTSTKKKTDPINVLYIDILSCPWKSRYCEAAAVFVA